MLRWYVRPASGPLRGAVEISADVAIGSTAMVLAAVANGESRLDGIAADARFTSARRALAELGVAVQDELSNGGSWRVRGAGLDGLRAPVRPIECGDSPILMSLLAGLLTTQHFDSRLSAQGAASRAPMAAVTRSLRARGARIDGEFDATRNEEISPLQIRALSPGARLGDSETHLGAASIQVKAALLLSGLRAAGPTAFTEAVVSPDHAERLLTAMGASLEAIGPAVLLEPCAPGGALAPLEMRVPGDTSAAAFVLAAGHVVRRSQVIVRGVCINPTRTGCFEVMRDVGGGVGVEPRRDAANEPVGDLFVGDVAARSPVRVGGELAARCRHEIGALVAVAAACPRGVSEFRDLTGLGPDMPSGFANWVDMLRGFGLGAELLPDGFRVSGGGRPRGGMTVHSRGDADLARAAALLGLMADGDTVISHVESAADRDPGFVAALTSLGARIDVLS